MPRYWNATAATMVGTAGDRNTSASAQRPSRVWLRVAAHETQVLVTMPNATAPTITPRVLGSGAARYEKAFVKPRSESLLRACADGGCRKGTRAVHSSVSTGR